jgi:DNA polymerase-4
MSANQTRKILHVDMDAFYASVEQRDDPSLRGRPLAVGGSRERGVVAAASYEARRFGVRSAMPSVTARRLCPDLLFVRPRFEVYKSISQQIRGIFAEVTSLVEPLSLDEAYLDVTDALADGRSASSLAKDLRQRIFETTGLTASAGVSYNKFLAKLASDQRKPNGQFVIPPELGAAFVETLPVGKFHGVGPVTAASMKRLGIETGGDLRRQTLAFLQKHFGKSGPFYYSIARGIDHRPVVSDRPRKSVGSETTFADDLDDRAALAAITGRMVDDVWSWCARTRITGRTVTLKLKFADFQIVTRSRSGTARVPDRATLERTSLALLDGLFPLPKRVRLLGVSMSNLEGAADAPAQQSLPL